MKNPIMKIILVLLAFYFSRRILQSHFLIEIRSPQSINESELFQQQIEWVRGNGGTVSEVQIKVNERGYRGNRNYLNLWL